ncbi:hypothetical protein [Stutzerimonas nitrititolerans]|uniref:hypothetical protein n=1 Tax=Stutzerimonas nitrititolerans TaxID=2482751 RepID=UPI0028A12251|nr:hypothetical protein [Stutzerimonas nitrititolerans]
MTNIVHIDPDCGIVVDDQGAHIDAFGQVMLLGIFSDLCQLRGGEMRPDLAVSLNGIASRLGKLLERYEP